LRGGRVMRYGMCEARGMGAGAGAD